MNSRISVVLNCVIFCALLFSGHIRAEAQVKTALLLFGGDDHKTFLGCLNCVDTSEFSVCNEYGHFGSEYSSDSIWNEYGHFGSEYSSQSPWDGYSSDAPIIVDKDGNSFGYFTVNEFHHDRTRINWLVAVLDYFEKTKDLGKTREIMCGA